MVRIAHFTDELLVLPRAMDVKCNSKRQGLGEKLAGSTRETEGTESTRVRAVQVSTVSEMTTQSVGCLRSVRYGLASAGRYNTFDAHYETSSTVTPKPILVFIGGGGWQLLTGRNAKSKFWHGRSDGCSMAWWCAGGNGGQLSLGRAATRST